MPFDDEERVHHRAQMAVELARQGGSRRSKRAHPPEPLRVDVAAEAPVHVRTPGAGRRDPGGLRREKGRVHLASAAASSSRVVLVVMVCSSINIMHNYYNFFFNT